MGRDWPSLVRMVLTMNTWLPTEEELTVEEVPLGTPSLRSAAMHLGKYCEVQNNEFMLCRTETQDPRACLGAGEEVTSCSMEFFRKVKATCAAEFMSYVNCMEKSSTRRWEWRGLTMATTACPRSMTQTGLHLWSKSLAGWTMTRQRNLLSCQPTSRATTSTGEALVSIMRTRERSNVPPAAPNICGLVLCLSPKLERVG